MPNLNVPLSTTEPGKTEVDTIIGLVLGGKGGLGTKEACSAPERLAAVDELAACFGGISYIDHFFRRDDRSGTTDTMKERFKIQRFCNGRGGGLLGGNPSNLANDDADPIRRECAPATATAAKTACTLWPSPVQCTAGDPGCTQGLVVALSENDPGLGDITISIARRVRLDPNNQTVGFAGREAAFQVGNAAPNLNTISPSADNPQEPLVNISPNNFNVRASAYIASRRLFVNKSDLPVGNNRPGGRTADDIAADEAELNLYAWMTDPILGGRFNVDPILIAHGFLPCTDDYSDPIGAGNLCSSQLPPPPAESTPNNCTSLRPKMTHFVVNKTSSFHKQCEICNTTYC